MFQHSTGQVPARCATCLRERRPQAGGHCFPVPSAVLCRRSSHLQPREGSCRWNGRLPAHLLGACGSARPVRIAACRVFFRGARLCGSHLSTLAVVVRIPVLFPAQMSLGYWFFLFSWGAFPVLVCWFDLSCPGVIGLTNRRINFSAPYPPDPLPPPGEGGDF